MRRATTQLVGFVRQELAAQADPAKAAPMQAYMKTDMPFLGVQKPGRVPVIREIAKRFPPADRHAWEEGVLALWRLPHREEKYLALEYAALGRAFHNAAALALYARLIRDGAWWDLVDFVAAGLLSPTLRAHRDQVRPAMERWIDDDDMWIRRAALLSQLRHKEQTDEAQLFDHCLRRAHEKEFFIRKAIGWALRDFSWTRPSAVQAFLRKNRNRLSPLSIREGSKRLAKLADL